jgi:hypothetical protein
MQLVIGAHKAQEWFSGPKHYASRVTAFLFHYLMQSLTDCKSIGSCEKVWLVAVRIVPSWIVFLPWVDSFVVLLHGLIWTQVLLPLPGSLSIVCARLLCGQVWDKWQTMGLQRWAMSSSHVCRHIPERIELPCRQCKLSFHHICKSQDILHSKAPQSTNINNLWGSASIGGYQTRVIQKP